ncbi:MAG TPA: TlpA disulfide reductase family protein [Flavisolibacter sp.]|jgi:thiol-disulfide isomerase/thioredoxin
MKSLKYLATLLAVTCCMGIALGCNSSNGKDKPGNQSAYPEQDSTITLIFLKNPNAKQTLTATFNLNKEKMRQKSIFTVTQSNNAQFSYMEPSYNETSFTAENFTGNDTIVLKAKQPVFLLSNAYPRMMEYYFYLGDTAIFSYGGLDGVIDPSFQKAFAYPGQIFTCRVTNRESKPYDFNYSIVKRSLDGMYFFEDYSVKYAVQKKGLDSLYEAGLLSAAYYPVHNDNLRYEYLYNLLHSPAREQFFREFTAADLQREDILPLKRYRQFLTAYITKVLMKEKYIKVANGISINYLDAYDSIKANFTGKVRDYMLLECLESILQHQPTDVSAKYTDRFMADVQDPVMKEFVTSNYFISQTETEGKSVLTNMDKSRMVDFPQMLEALRGKVVFIDLWASWCAPCRAAMPASEKLRQEYSGKPVAFVYLSIDQKYSAWQNAAREEKLASYPLSYLLLNPQEAALSKKINLESIPRYLIIDKGGKMVHQNAPGPESDEIRKLLNKYIFQ